MFSTWVQNHSPNKSGTDSQTFSSFSEIFLISSEFFPNLSEISPILSVGNKIPSDVFKIGWEEKSYFVGHNPKKVP